jgi:hypothetical protein
VKYARETVVSVVRDLIGLWLVDWGMEIMTRRQFKELIEGIIKEWEGRKANNG